MAVESRKVYKASSISGTRVLNSSGENLGKIEEAVIDLEHNTLAYAAIAFGGILGFGEKLFAVPWSKLELKHDADGMYFIFEVTREELATAPGFNPNNWPDLADPDWRAQVDAFYRGDA